tara:strand:+ start:1677 stop:1967 length:291 start_codon:yes stop_codon:yes gene_type:complete
MTLRNLREKAKDVILNVGDMVIDLATGQVGLLVRRDRRISIEEDDVYFWHVRWTSDKGDPTSTVNPIWMEEVGLKLSILAGMLEYHSSIQENFRKK